MKSFVRSLSRANDKTDTELDTIKDFYTENELSFRILQKRARKSLIRPVLTRSASQKTKIVIPKAVNNTHKTKRAQNDKHNQIIQDPFKYSNMPTYRNSVFPKPSNVAPQRYYNSVNRQRFVAEQVIQYMEQVANPDPSISPLYEATVDPVLHVGDFNELEINWKERKPYNC